MEGLTFLVHKISDGLKFQVVSQWSENCSRRAMWAFASKSTTSNLSYCSNTVRAVWEFLKDQLILFDRMKCNGTKLVESPDIPTYNVTQEIFFSFVTLVFNYFQQLISSK